LDDGRLNAIHKVLQLRRQRRLQADGAVTLWVLELELPRMQKHALEAHFLQQFVVFKVGGIVKQFSDKELKEIARYVESLPTTMQTIQPNRFR